jgi:ATP-binding cassette, subfamily B, bacterial
MLTPTDSAKGAESAFDLATTTLWASLRRMATNARRLLQLLSPAAPRAFQLLVISALIEATATTVLPYTTKRLIDAVPIATASGILAVPLTWLAIEAGLLIVQIVARDLARYGTRVLEVCGSPFLTERVLQKSCKVPYACFESSAFLDKLSRARQDAPHWGINYAVQSIVVGRSALTFLGCLGLLLWIAPLWTLPLLVIAAAVPFLYDVARARRSFELERKNIYRNRQGWYLEWLLTANEAAREIRATGVGGWLVGLHARVHAPFRDGQVDLARRHFKRGWVVALIGTGMLSAPYAYFVVTTIQRQHTLGDMLLFALAFRQAALALGQLLTALANAFEHHLYIHNLLQLLDHPEEDEVDSAVEPRADHVFAEAPEFELQDVWFTYPNGKQPVLRGLDLRVRAGETIAIVGRNGIGKTTLVKLLLGLYPLERGKFIIGGIDAATRSSSWRRDNLGVVFQDFVKYQFSTRWNVGLGWCPDADNEGAIFEALEMADATKLVDDLPAGIETPLGAAFGGQDLSGGQWQRIALARLFMRQSRLWIMDEPTSAMDPETEERTVRTFRQWTKGRTAIIITHRFSTARIADRIAVVDEGRVTEFGTHDELLRAGGGYARIFNMAASAYEPTNSPPESSPAAIVAPTI